MKFVENKMGVMFCVAFGLAMVYNIYLATVIDTRPAAAGGHALAAIGCLMAAVWFACEFFE